MNRFVEIVLRVLRWITAPFRWLWRFCAWIGQLIIRIVVGFFGPPLRRLRELVQRIRKVVENLIEKFLEYWARIWQPGSSGERLPEERIGMLGVPALAALTLALVWYGLPIARQLNIGRTWFIILGFVVWILSLLLWRSFCRADRDSAIARAVQGVYRSTGLRRLDQVCFVVSAIALPWLTVTAQIQLLPLTVAAIVAFACLLAVKYEERSTSTMRVPDFPDGTTVDDSPDLDGETVMRRFEWQVTAFGLVRQHAVEILVSPDRAQLAAEQNPGFADPERLVDWVVYETPEIDDLARKIHDVCHAEGYSILATVTSFAAACQGIRYVSDSESTGHDEYWRYPIQTVMDQVGDCEDFAVLLCALLRRSGFRSVLVLLPGHAAVGVEAPPDVSGAYFEHEGVRYYFCETTDTGWSVGELPPDLRGRPFTVIEVPAWGVVPA